MFDGNFFFIFLNLFFIFLKWEIYIYLKNVINIFCLNYENKFFYLIVVVVCVIFVCDVVVVCNYSFCIVLNCEVR